MKKLLIVIAATMMMAGCAQQSFNIKKDVAVAPQKVVTHHFFISGLGQSKTIDAAEICGGSDKVVRTETQETFANGLLRFVTLGIYTPREARVYCSK